MGKRDDEESTLTIWPEWSETEIQGEKWISKHIFEDPEGLTTLPRSISKHIDSWKRVPELLGDAVNIVSSVTAVEESFYSQNVLDFENIETTLDADEEISEEELEIEPKLVGESEPKAVNFDGNAVEGISANSNKLNSIEFTRFASPFMQANKHLLGSQFYTTLIGIIQFLFKKARNGDNIFPWENIFPKGKDGLPFFNSSGKYAVKLYWLGAWRKILVDDRIPIDCDGKILMLCSTSPTEIWPLLLCKALLKSLSEESNKPEFGDFDILNCLRGLIPEKVQLPIHTTTSVKDFILGFWNHRISTPQTNHPSSPNSKLSYSYSNSSNQNVLKEPTKDVSSTCQIFLHRILNQTKQPNVHELLVPYVVEDVRPLELGDEEKLIIVLKSCISIGTKTGEMNTIWVHLDEIGKYFGSVIAYYLPTGFKYSKSQLFINDINKSVDSYRIPSVLYSAEYVTASIIIMVNTCGKNTWNSTAPCLLVEDMSWESSGLPKTVLRKSTDSVNAFFLKLPPNLFANEEFNYDDEAKYLSDVHGVQMREIEDAAGPFNSAWNVLLKHIVMVQEKTTILPVLYMPDLLNHSTTMLLQNIETGEEIQINDTTIAPVTIEPNIVFIFNQNGYILIIESRGLQNRALVKWKLRLFSKNLSTVPSEKEIVFLKFNYQDMGDTFYPNKHNSLFRSVVKLKDASSSNVSVQANFSIPDVWIKMSLFHNETEIAAAEGRGIATLHNVLLQVTDEPPAKLSKEDKKAAQSNIAPPLSKNRYILEASIVTAGLEKLSNSFLQQLEERPNSRGSKANSAASKKKKTVSSAGTGTGGATNDIEFSWNLRFISTDNANIIVAKDTEKEDRYKSIKDSWEVAAPGRSNRAKELRENYLKSLENGIVKPVKIEYQDKNLKTWTLANGPMPVVRLTRRNTSRLFHAPSRNIEKNSIATKPTVEISEPSKSEPFVLDLESTIEEEMDSLKILDANIMAANSRQREQIKKGFADKHELVTSIRKEEKEKRSRCRTRAIEIIDEKLKEVEFWQKIDQTYREEYRVKVLVELEESNAKLKAAIDTASKNAETAVESLTEEINDRKKKAQKK